MNRQQKQIADKDFSAMRKKPSLYFKKALGVKTLEKYHVDILDNDIAKHSRVAIKATHSLGKTWLVGRVVLWFLNCFHNSKVVTTAPTHRQVVELLWGELRSAYKHAKMPIGGHLTTNKLKFSEDWNAIGFSPRKEAGTSDEQKGSSFQGWHAENILVVFDEAVGISADVWKMVEGLLTSGAVVKFIAIGNPTTRACNFFDCFNDSQWLKRKLSCFDSPNMIANGITDLSKMQDELDFLGTLNDEARLKYTDNYKKPVPYLLSAQWVMNYVFKYGIKHPLVLSKVLGEFPFESDHTLINYGYVDTAINREVIIKNTDRRAIGIDVARYGSDKTVFTDLIGDKHMSVKVIVKRDTNHVSGEAIKYINNIDEIRETDVLVDCTGIGSGVFDNLVQAQREGIISKHIELHEIHFGASCPTTGNKEDDERDKKDYINLKSKMFDKLADDLKDRIDLLPESIYLEELPTIQYRINAKGKMQIESKEDYKKRTGKNSPDHSDSLALANFAKYVNITVGKFFKKNTENKLLTKSNKNRDTFSRISKRIKVKEY